MSISPGFAFRAPRRSAVLPPPALFGAHRIVNAGTALACLDAPGMPRLSDETIARGLAAARWPGRLQRLLCAGRREVWLDGGHNLAAGAALAAGWRGRPLGLVVGMMRGKDSRGFLVLLAPCAAALTAVPGEANALPPSDIAARAAALGLPADVAASVSEAIDGAAPHTRSRLRLALPGGERLAASAAVEVRLTRPCLGRYINFWIGFGVFFAAASRYVLRVLRYRDHRNGLGVRSDIAVRRHQDGR